MSKNNEVLNKEIQKWLKGKRDYKEGVALYYKHAEFGKKIKIFPFAKPKENINRLVYELERLSFIDPEIKKEAIARDLEQKKQEDLIKKHKPLYDEAIAEVKLSIENKDFEKAEDFYQHACNHNYLGEENIELDELRNAIDIAKEQSSKQQEEKDEAVKELLAMDLEQDPNYNSMLHIAAVLEIDHPSKKKEDVIGILIKAQQLLGSKDNANE